MITIFSRSLSSVLCLTLLPVFAAACPAAEPGNAVGSDGAAAEGPAADGSAAPPTTRDRLVYDNPAQPLTGFTVYAPDEKRNHPEANEPTYVYLRIGQEAVAVPGPLVADPAGTLFSLSAPAITIENPRETSADGVNVRINDRLSYSIAIDDFEGEAVLARVELARTAAGIASRFIFVATGEGGVAHELTIAARADGESFGPAAPVTIESR